MKLIIIDPQREAFITADVLIHKFWRFAERAFQCIYLSN